MILTDNSILNVSNNSFIDFAYAINLLSKVPKCFFQYFSNRQLDNHHGNYSIIFNKNIEKYTQNAYNNLPIVHCSWLPQSAYNTTLPPVVNKQYIQFINASGKSNVLPQFIRKKILCHCGGNENYHDCYKEVLSPIYAGQMMTVSLVTSRSTHEYINEIKPVVDTSSPTACMVTDTSGTKQSINQNNCTELQYSIAFPSDSWCELYLMISFREKHHTDIYYITQLPCPTGFIKDKGVCQCDSSINEYNIKCDINDQTILRPANSWITATTHNNSYTYHISLYCPFHYCLPHSSHLNFSTPNSQCQFNRSGLLCGHCQQGLSTVFSSFNCQHCSSVHLFITIPIAMAGIVLVLMLFVFNLTVTDGTISGLYFMLMLSVLILQCSLLN